MFTLCLCSAGHALSAPYICSHWTLIMLGDMEHCYPYSQVKKLRHKQISDQLVTQLVRETSGLPRHFSSRACPFYHAPNSISTSNISAFHLFSRAISFFYIVGLLIQPHFEKPVEIKILSWTYEILWLPLYLPCFTSLYKLNSISVSPCFPLEACLPFTLSNVDRCL